jgi:hypothetical protein
MTEDKKRLALLARGVQSLRRQSRDLRREIDFLDRFSNRLPSRACAAARSYLTMIEHGADLALAQVQQLKAEIANREAESRVERLAAKLGVPR